MKQLITDEFGQHWHHTAIQNTLISYRRVRVGMGPLQKKQFYPGTAACIKHKHKWWRCFHLQAFTVHDQTSSAAVSHWLLGFAHVVSGGYVDKNSHRDHTEFGQFEREKAIVVWW